MGKNAGIELEKRINRVNLRYRKQGKAVVDKLDPPVQFGSHGNAFLKQSTVDYVGVIKGGLFVAVEAKASKEKCSFPLKNIAPHQMQYLKSCAAVGGIASFLIWPYKHMNDQAYLVPATWVSDYEAKHNRRSIPWEDFPEKYLVDIEEYLANWI